MNAALWPRLAEIVPAALELAPEARADFLDRTCTRADGTRDLDLLARARSLLTAATDADRDGSLVSPVARRAALPERVGPWRVTGLLGEGGMGVVYAAERAGDGFVQRAALKRVRAGVGADFRARFLRERGLLAGLDHAGIARLLDGGVDDDGAPYLALERVDGVPITEAPQSALPERLELFVEACDAVAYAHRNLVVHRDLKPAHILVTAGEDAGATRVKLLDFGIACLLDNGDGGAGVFQTRTGAGPLTPQYAAPEQLLGQAVTTATDVYALGLVLFELLVGRRPYALAGLTASQAERTVCESPLPAPSASVSPEQARALRGDLDVIVAKALARDPAARYASAEALGADLRRHLAGLPVQARAATRAYRAGRFVRRHRAGVATAAAGVLLVSSLVGFYTVRLRAERDVAVRATHTAQAETARAEAVAGFLERLLRAPSTSWYVDGTAKGPDTPIRAVLDEAAASVDREVVGQPDLLADLHHILGDTYGGLGLGAEARRHHRRVLALRESLYTPPDPRLAEALFYDAVFRPAGEERAQMAELERAVAMQRVRPEGNNFPFMVEALATWYANAGRDDAAAPLLREGIAFAEARFVPGHDGFRYRDRIVATLSQRLAEAQLSLGRLDAATRTLATADSALARLPREVGHYTAWRSQTCVRGRLLRLRRRYAEAEPPLLACAGAPGAPASPFPAPDADAADLRLARRMGSADLMALYDAWGRPRDAAPYRAEATRHLAHRDSLRRAFRPLVARRTSP